jgi:hypothetical protein
MAITKRSNLGLHVGSPFFQTRSAQRRNRYREIRETVQVRFPPYESAKQRARYLSKAHFSDEGHSQRVLRRIRQAQFCNNGRPADGCLTCVCT